MTFRRFTLEEIASADCIARSGDAAELRATLASIEPTTVVSDDEGETKVTMLQLAGQHKASATDTQDEPMTEEDAWRWAVSDLVFGGFAPVAGFAWDAETATIVADPDGAAVCLARGHHRYGDAAGASSVVYCLDCPDSYRADGAL